MRRVLVALAALVLLIVLVIAIAVGFVVYEGPRFVRPLLEKLATTALQRPVSIESLQWSWEDGTVTADGIAVGTGPDQLTARRLTLFVRRADLDPQHLVVDRIAVEAPGGVLELDEHYRPVIGAADDRGSDSGPPSLPIPLTVRAVTVDAGELTLRRADSSGATRSATLQITQASASDIAIGGLTEPGLALTATLAGALNGAPLTANTTVRMSAAEPDVDATVVLKQVPVQGGLLPLPAPVEKLSGTVAATAVVHMGGTPRREEVQLDARLTNARLPGLPSGDVSAKSVAVPKARIDLVAHTVDLGGIEVEAPKASVELTDDGVVLPVPKSAETGEASWSVRPGAVKVRGGEVSIRRGDARTVLQLDRVDWDGSADGPAVLDARATVAGGGVVSVRGTVTGESPAAELAVRVDALELPPVARLVDLPLALSSGQAGGTVDVDYRGHLRGITGDITVSDVHTAPPDTARPTEVMAVAKAEATFAVDPDATPGITVSSLRLSYPYLMVVRAPDGTFPASLLQSGSHESPAAPAARRAANIERVEIADGKVDFVDTTLPSPFWTRLTDVTASADAITVPHLAVRSFTLAGRRDELSPIEVTGAFTANGLEGKATATDVLLDSLSPYVVPLLGYRITSGRLTADATATPAPPLLESTTKLTLQNVNVLQTGTDVILEQSGVPLPIALGLISGSGGVIDLTLPVLIDTRSGSVSVGSIVGQAVRKAIVTALTSPLRILGSLFGTRGAPHAFAVDPIPFPAGSAKLDSAARARIADIARIVQAHQTLLVVLLPQISPDDIGAVGEGGAARLAAARNAAAREGFVDGDDGPGLPAARLIPSSWKPSDAATATGQSGVYVELQDGG